MQNFQTLAQPLLGEKYVAEKEKKIKKNNTKYSGQFVPQQRPRAAHALRSDQQTWTVLNTSHIILNLGMWTSTVGHGYPTPGSGVSQILMTNPRG